jgi:hypothetical protein
MAHPDFIAHTENGRYLLFDGHKTNVIRCYLHTNQLKTLLKGRMVKRGYTIINPRTRRSKNENQTSGKTLAGLPQVQFTKKIRL